jgi:AbrB family looped-hinge helix DNA binding protein
MCGLANQQDSRSVICFVRFTKIVNGGEIMRIENVELVPEHGQYKVDGSGRIIIPAYMRNKFKIENGDYMEYFTAYVDGDWFLCVRKNEEYTEQKKQEEVAKAAAKKAKKNK